MVNKKEIIKAIKPKLNYDTAIKDFEELEDLPKKDVVSKPSNVGNNFVDYFTFLERTNTIGKHNVSFWNVWNDRSEYKKKRYVRNLLLYYKTNHPKMTPPQVWWRIFNVYFASISIFKPTYAMTIYYKFEPTSILDFTMGWGGRLVGAAAMNIPYYTGIDMNKELEKPYKEMVKVLKKYSHTKVKLIFKDALKVDYSKIKYDLVLTSPPYYNLEVYSHQEEAYKTKKEWNEKFYIPIVSMTYKYLSVGGYYCLNVPEEVYENVLIDLLGKADMFIPLMKQIRSITEYKEFTYVWKKK